MAAVQEIRLQDLKLTREFRRLLSALKLDFEFDPLRYHVFGRLLDDLRDRPLRLVDIHLKPSRTGRAGEFTGFVKPNQRLLDEVAAVRAIKAKSGHVSPFPLGD